MRALKASLAVFLLSIVFDSSAQEKAVGHFHKVVVSPYIQATFVDGDKESVSVDHLKVDQSKLHIEVSNSTLHIYLDGARHIPKNEKDYSNGHEERRSLYDKTSVVVTINYKTLNELSIRGEEEHLFKSPIAADKLTLRVYGESNITFEELNLRQLHTTMYGESVLEMKSGSIKEQHYTCYGEGNVNALAINGRVGRVTSYGEADIRLNVSDRIKITAIGEAKVHYKGNPQIVKGLNVGEVSLVKMD
ncbi:head GIN domain-containing protein [Flavitalea antarctica]